MTIRRLYRMLLLCQGNELPNGVRYRRLGENQLAKRETAIVQNQLQKTHRVPAVRCTLCWALRLGVVTILSLKIQFLHHCFECGRMFALVPNLNE